MQISIVSSSYGLALPGEAVLATLGEDRICACAFPQSVQLLIQAQAA